MSGIPPIVPGTVSRIYHDEAVPNPYLQITFAKILDKDNTGQPRWKIALSDTTNFIQAVALSPLHDALDKKHIEPGCIVKITKYSMASLKGHYIMLVGEVDLNSVIRVDGRIGDPLNIELTSPKNGPPTNAPAPQPAPTYMAQPAYAAPVKQTQSYSVPSYVPPQAPMPQQSGYSSYSGARPAGMVASDLPPPPLVNSWSSNSNAAISAGPNVANSNTPYGNNNSNNYGAGGGNKFAGQGPMGGKSQMTGDDAETIYTPICGLSPYQNTFVMKARCTYKSDVKTWAKEKSEGKLFSVNLIDSTGEIKMTGFKDTVDKFYDVLQVGQVYSITGVAVKMANKRFSNVKNEYELFLEGNSQIQLLADSDMPVERFSFVPIKSLNDSQKDEVIDVIGVAHEVAELGNITVKSTGKQLSKRDLTLIDTTGHAVRVTLWGREAEEFTDFKNRAVIAIKGVRVSDWNGRTLSTMNGSIVSVNPDIQEAHELRGWYDSVGYNQPPVMMSVSGGAAAGSGVTAGRDDRKMIAQIKEDNLGQFDKPDYASILATITYIKSDAAVSYPACPGEDCNKKVIEDGPTIWRCEKCQKVYDRCEYRYILSVQVSDETGQTWLNVFNETGASILGISADDLHRLKLEDEEAYKKIFERALLKPFLFKLRIKQEQYQGEAKIRNTVVSAVPVNYADESGRLISKIDPVL